ncbi:MAG: protein kinase domain-containing protein, partial [Planctomycetota bacterium]
MADCLTRAEIGRFLANALSPDENVRAEAHIAMCEKCRQQVKRGRADDELFGRISRTYQAQTVSGQDEPGDVHVPPRPHTESIEGYEILSEIRRGGQGVVYEAVQKATKRTVALKVLLAGPYASPRQRHRFEREIDLVASLQHSNIVTVYDSGATRDGRHYFAMEYVHGVPLDAYVSDKNLTIDDTLRLFQIICDAVNYAHQRGVIHRDLKPSNIRIDANGQPHILDFGLAKAAGADLTNGVPVTVAGEFMGTPAYASPEQTKGDPNLIDIRTDVYSLGVVLYEMLTGKYPYSVVGQMAEVFKNIAEAEPKKPSTIRCQINDEVETIILRALAKKKDHRYQSAENLARDVEHYLNGEPIDAKRDSGWYVLKKTLSKYKVAALAATGFVLLLIGSAGVSTTLWLRADEQRRLAEVARAAEAEQRAEAVRQRDAAELQTYIANLTAADAALRLNDGAEMHRRLDAAPERYRNWEWRHLRARSDLSLATLRGHSSWVWSASFSPDGTRIVTGSYDKTAKVWDAATDSELATLCGHSGPVTSASFSPDGTRIVTRSRDDTAKVWDAATGSELATLPGDRNGFTSASFS